MVQEFAEQAKVLAAQPTATWEHQIDFEIVDVSSETALILNVHAAGDNARIYRYVDEGTEVRYATMTRDFVPKTIGRRLQSGPGRGRVAYVDKSRPRSGIQAREFSAVVAETLQAPFSAAIGKILRKR